VKARIEFTASLDVEGVADMTPVDALLWVRRALLHGDKHAEGWTTHSADLRAIDVVRDDD
jgi:hypothetical protein